MTFRIEALLVGVAVSLAISLMFTMPEPEMLVKGDRVQEISTGKYGIVKEIRYARDCRVAVFLDDKTWARSVRPYADGATSSLYIRCWKFKKVGGQDE